MLLYWEQVRSGSMHILALCFVLGAEVGEEVAKSPGTCDRLRKWRKLFWQLLYD